MKFEGEEGSSVLMEVRVGVNGGAEGDGSVGDIACVEGGGSLEASLATGGSVEDGPLGAGVPD